jgi:hypothetical protein
MVPILVPPIKIFLFNYLHFSTIDNTDDIMGFHEISVLGVPLLALGPGIPSLSLTYSIPPAINSCQVYYIRAKCIISTAPLACS